MQYSPMKIKEQNMIRRIIKIDEEKCNGCGLCADACHEGAIGMINGKAKLLNENHCDGLGDCLPVCPTGAISFEEREVSPCAHSAPAQIQTANILSNWPVQIKLAPLNAPYFKGADLLIAADCTAFSYANFHEDFIRNRIVLTGCPKLDMVDYSEKLAEIIKSNDISSITVTRMVVPCCGGLEFAVRKAVETSGKDIPLDVVTISIEGEII